MGAGSNEHASHDSHHPMSHCETNSECDSLTPDAVSFNIFQVNLSGPCNAKVSRLRYGVRKVPTILDSCTYRDESTVLYLRYVPVLSTTPYVCASLVSFYLHH